jgi:hypothetical protein
VTGRHQGGIREASGRHPGGNWEASEKHLDNPQLAAADGRPPDAILQIYVYYVLGLEFKTLLGLGGAPGRVPVDFPVAV